MVTEAVLLPACSYCRVSTDAQTGGQSLDDQPEAIARLAASEGRAILFPFSDAQTGHDENRKDYQRMLALAKAKKFETLYVWKFDRLARDMAELLMCARTLRRLGIRLVSVEDGEFKGDPTNVMRAWQGEDFSKQLAKNVRPRKERSAREGQTMGKASLGYTLVPQPPASGGRYVPAKRVVNEDIAPIVRELFTRAAAGWSERALALWMNTTPGHPAAPGGGLWVARTVGHILRNPVYVGNVRYNQRHTGRFERAADKDRFVVPGKHPPLIDEQLFNQVQGRLDVARRHQSRARITRPAPLAAGFLVCAECGGPMTTSRYADKSQLDRYLCARGDSGADSCPSTSYQCGLAHDALLAQVARLQGRPWLPLAAERLWQADPAAEERNRLAAELHTTEAGLRRHFKRFADMITDPTPQQAAAYQDIANELSDRITALEADIAALPSVSASPDDLTALHRELAHVSLGDVVGALAETGDTVALRALLLKLVDRAKVVERVPTNRSRWLRAEVTWAPNVRLLLDAGLLTLAPDVARPDYPSDSIEARRARQRAYYHRKQALAV